MKTKQSMQSRAPRVWQVHKTDRNLEPARKYGDITVILTNPTGDYHRDACTVEDRIMLEWEPGDYLNLVGHPLYVAVAYRAAHATNQEGVMDIPVQTLCWNKHNLDYEVVAV